MSLIKNNFLVLVSLLVSLNMLSQSMTNDQTLDNDYLSSKTTPVFKGYKNTMGSIYANKEFQMGSVYKNGKLVASNVALRYNVQAEEIELKANTSTSATVANVIKADPSTGT